MIDLLIYVGMGFAGLVALAFIGLGALMVHDHYHYEDEYNDQQYG